MSGRLNLIREINQADGYCYTSTVPKEAPQGDDVSAPLRSGLRLFEDNVELGPWHSEHQEIRAKGAGRFSHWGRLLWFSSSDNSDPRTNGRTYTILYNLNDDPRIAILTGCLNVDYDALSQEQQYLLGERAFNALVPNVRLSEFGRLMFTDNEFLADYERFDRQNYRSFDRKFALKELLKLTLPLTGDLAECGVFRGASANLIAKAMTQVESSKRLHLFDSFAGLPEPRPEVDGSYWQVGALASNFGEVAANLKKYGRQIVYHPGWIPQQFGDVARERFCFVHIDVDLYDATRESLAFFAPRMVLGGLIICDDYGFQTCPGAKRAVDEFAAQASMPVVHLPTGQGVLFFVHK